jgi:large subunit ribosomal protein L23
MKDPRDIVLAPVVSEKSYDAIEKDNVYTFVVDSRAHKIEIGHAVAAIFDVKVERVNTANRRGKVKRTAWKTGRRKNEKYAMVKLAAGNSIDIFGV